MQDHTIIFDFDNCLTPYYSDEIWKYGQKMYVKACKEYLGLNHDDAWSATLDVVKNHTSNFYMPTFEGHGHTEEHVDFYVKTHVAFDVSYLKDNLCMDTVNAVKGIKQKKAVFSHGPKPYVLKGLDTMGMRDVFEESHVYALDVVGMDHTKTTKKGYKKVLDSLGATPEKSVMVEDTIYNLVSAKKVGMKTVLIDHKGKYEGHEHLVHVDYVFSDLHSFLKTL